MVQPCVSCAQTSGVALLQRRSSAVHVVPQALHTPPLQKPAAGQGVPDCHEVHPLASVTQVWGVDPEQVMLPAVQGPVQLWHAPWEQVVPVWQ